MNNTYFERHLNFNRQLLKRQRNLSKIVGVITLSAICITIATAVLSGIVDVGIISSDFELFWVAVMFVVVPMSILIAYYTTKVIGTKQPFYRIETIRQTETKTVLSVAAKIEHNLAQSAVKSIQRNLQNSRLWPVKSTTIYPSRVVTSMLSNLMTANPVKNNLTLYLRDQTNAQKAFLELNNRVYRNMIPDYDKYEADDFFSFDDFGTDSKKYFEFLEYYTEPESEISYGRQKKFNASQSEFRKMQKLFAVLCMKFDAYHSARSKFEQSQNTSRQRMKSFKQLLREEFENNQRRHTEYDVDLVRLKECSYDICCLSNIVEDFDNVEEYSQKLMWRNFLKNQTSLQRAE